MRGEEGRCVGTYGVEQIIGILRQHESGRTTKELCRQYGFSEQTLKRWKAKYKGMNVGEAKRLESLEEENRRPKHCGRRALAREARPRGPLSKDGDGPARRHAAAYFRSEFALSERRACRLIHLHRSTSRYPRRRGEDKELRQRLRTWASRHPR